MYKIGNKDPKAKIKNLEYMLDSQKYNIKKNKTKSQKLQNIDMKFALKIGYFFLQGNSTL